MDNIEKMLRELRADIKTDSDRSLERMENRITNTINQHTDQQILIVHGEIDKIKQICSEQDKRLLEVEKQIRIRNLIFFAVDEGEKTYEELLKTITKIINEDLKVSCNKNELEMVKRMGKKHEDKTRPIIVTFTTYGKKIAILKNKKFLSNSSVYLKEDYPSQILENRKKLQEQLLKERAEGKIAYLRYDKLIVREPTTNEERKDQPYRAQNNKKRELVSTPPNQVGQNYQTSAPVGSPVKLPAAKKTKVKKNQRPHNPMTSYFNKLSDTPAYNTAHSSNESDD